MAPTKNKAEQQGVLLYDVIELSWAATGLFVCVKNAGMWCNHENINHANDDIIMVETRLRSHLCDSDIGSASRSLICRARFHSKILDDYESEGKFNYARFLAVHMVQSRKTTPALIKGKLYVVAI